MSATQENSAVPACPSWCNWSGSAMHGYDIRSSDGLPFRHHETEGFDPYDTILVVDERLTAAGVERSEPYAYITVEEERLTADRVRKLSADLLNVASRLDTIAAEK